MTTMVKKRANRNQIIEDMVKLKHSFKSSELLCSEAYGTLRISFFRAMCQPVTCSWHQPPLSWVPLFIDWLCGYSTSTCQLSMIAKLFFHLTQFFSLIKKKIFQMSLAHAFLKHLSLKPWETTFWERLIFSISVDQS